MNKKLMTLTAIHSKSPSASSRLRVRQKRSVTCGNDVERFIWDGLALVYCDGSDYLNELAIGGGNPVASDGKVMFNDRLGSTVAVKGDESYSMTFMTAFGESNDSGAFFTGKPFIGELGYAFLMRSYRPENGKWQTADPMGYPDGWNQLAYCNNGVTVFVDCLGGWQTYAFDYEVDFNFGDQQVDSDGIVIAAEILSVSTSLWESILNFIAGVTTQDLMTAQLQAYLLGENAPVLSNYTETPPTITGPQIAAALAGANISYTVCEVLSITMESVTFDILGGSALTLVTGATQI